MAVATLQFADLLQTSVFQTRQHLQENNQTGNENEREM